MPEQAPEQAFAAAAESAAVPLASNSSSASPRADVTGLTAGSDQVDFDVIIVGAGLSGIGVAYHLQRHCPRKSFVILEARGAIGGTWDLFRYPGVRSDSDMHTLGYRFRPWRGEKAIADGPSILAYVKETDLEKYAELREFPIIPCNLCGSQPNLKRAEMKALIRDWDRRFPGRVDNMFNALSNIVPSHLMDRKLFPFAGLRATGEADPQGDIAFDEEPCSADPAIGETQNASKPISIVQFDDL